MTTTYSIANTISTSQLRALRTEAAEAGDEKQVAICDAALAGDLAAIMACHRAIAAASAQA